MFDSKLVAFSDDGSILGIYSSTGVLKLWDTSSNILEHEFQPSERLATSATCILFSPKNPPKQKRTSCNELESSDLIALGTVGGTILIYSPSRQKVTEELKHSTTSSVTDLSWCSAKKLVSVGENKKIIAWKLNASKRWEIDIVSSKSCCALGASDFVTGDTNLNFISYNKSTKQTSSYVIPGHKQPIRQLLPVFLNEKSKATHFLSIADGDKYVYAWSTSKERKDPVGCFIVQDIAGRVSCRVLGSSSVGIAVTTKTGRLQYYVHHFNGASYDKPSKCKGTLKLITSETPPTCLTIIHVKFLSATELLIAYGTELFPRCERISLESLEGDVKLVRQDPSKFRTSKEVSLVKTVTPAVPNSVVHLTPALANPIEIKEIQTGTKRKKGNDAASLPMEDRLDALSITQPLGVAGSRPLNNYVHLLIQALHSKDSGLMNSLLIKGEDEDIVNNTVKRLPATHVVPLLQYLQDVMVLKGMKNLSCINWIKAVLYYHMSHLSSIPDKDTVFQPFYSIFSARNTSFEAVAKLNGRLNLLLKHVNNRIENVQSGAANATAEALLKYKEESDDEDRGLDLEVGPSESEDNWDDFPEVTDEEEEESEGKEEKDLGAKRKMDCDDSGNEEEEDDDSSHMSDDDDVELASESD